MVHYLLDTQYYLWWTFTAGTTVFSSPQRQIKYWTASTIQSAMLAGDNQGTHCALQHLRVTAKWAQANGEVEERKNAPIMKRVRRAQSAGLNWKKELHTYVAKYRGLPHSTPGKSPAELNYNRKFIGKRPDFTLEYRDDLDVRIKSPN